MKETHNCRVCGEGLPKPYLNLGKTPLANSYIKDNDIAGEVFYELAVTLCPVCNLSQLTVVVPPDLMFKHYLYVSSTTQTFRSHCDELAASALDALSNNTPPTVLDIGSNDGCLLSHFRKRGAQVIGVDPAENLAAEANAKGINTINSFWGAHAAQEVVRTAGNPDIITATNVFAHVDDIHDFLSNIELILSDTGLFIFEVPYLVDLVQKCEFDTIYHEHLSYFLLKPMQAAVESHGLRVVDVRHQSIHGGTIRVFVARIASDHTVAASVSELLSSEQSLGFYDYATYASFAATVENNKKQMLELLQRLLAEGKTIAGYGAAAKGNTLLNYYGVGREYIKYICDDNPKKHSYLTPGTHIPIVDPSVLSSDPCDYLVLLAWNFADEIRRRTSAYSARGGLYVSPVPVPVVL